jgi:hypothetical protein
MNSRSTFYTVQPPQLIVPDNPTDELQISIGIRIMWLDSSINVSMSNSFIGYLQYFRVFRFCQSHLLFWCLPLTIHNSWPYRQGVGVVHLD